MENWLNETLTDCGDLEIPGVIGKPEHVLPLSRYGIDRITLVNLGLPGEEVDRLYHSLFVYTVGLFELIKGVTRFLKEHVNVYNYQTKIWRVFQILLEYACKTDYEMITTQLEKEHGQVVNELEKKYKTEIDRLEVSEARHKGEARELRQLCDELTRAKREEEKRRD